MSIESARDFLTKVAMHEKFRAGLEGCKTGAERQQFALKIGKIKNSQGRPGHPLSLRFLAPFSCSFPWVHS